MNQNLKDLMVLAPEVGQALHDRKAVVALESTVIAHGLPHPLNLQTAASMENIIRKRGAIPATIAILDGKIHIGLSESERERIATGRNITKASLRDLPILLSRQGSGGTTVSATAHLAAKAGITVFATGGIGGVHRGWNNTFDISADLPALASTPVVTVCAGAKSVLDLPATIEWLETHGVPVLGFRADHFPAFYTQTTDPPLPVDVRVEIAQEVADIFKTRQRLGLTGGVLVCVPVPQEMALSNREVEGAVKSAMQDVETEGIKGRDVTPFLLKALTELTGERALTANRALLENNAAVAANISRAITPPQYV